MFTVKDLIPVEYRLNLKQEDPSFCVTGPDKYAIRRGRSCLNKLGEWEYEPFPSNRTEEFFERCRYSSLEEALEYYNKSLSKEEGKPNV